MNLVKKNIQEGRGIRFGRGATRGGNFDFASSNPLWRGAIDVFDFVISILQAFFNLN